MEHEVIEELMVFVGLMTTLGCITKIILSVINRRRGLAPQTTPVLDDIAQRLARIEQAVDATAVEVERISEAQRFTTKLLVEKGHQAVSANEGPRRVVTPH